MRTAVAWISNRDVDAKYLGDLPLRTRRRGESNFRNGVPPFYLFGSMAFLYLIWATKTNRHYSSESEYIYMRNIGPTILLYGSIDLMQFRKFYTNTR